MINKSILFLSLLLVGCHTKNEIEEISKRIILLESQITEQDAKLNLIQNSASNSRWLLWSSKEWVNPNLLNNFGYPKMISAFDTKEKCLKNAYGYVLPDGVVVGDDPYIVQDKNKTLNYVYRCLPSEVTPKF
jgi:hypothetical protein